MKWHFLRSNPREEQRGPALELKKTDSEQRAWRNEEDTIVFTSHKYVKRTSYAYNEIIWIQLRHSAPGLQLALKGFKVIKVSCTWPLNWGKLSLTNGKDWSSTTCQWRTLNLLYDIASYIMRTKEIIVFPQMHVISQKSTSSSSVLHLPFEMLTSFRMHYKLNWHSFKTVRLLNSCFMWGHNPFKQ